MRGLGAALALAWALLLAPVAAQTAATDGAALCDIYRQQTATVKTSLTNWCPGSAPYDPCSTTQGVWFGVACATVGGASRVVGLDVWAFGLTGSLPTTIGNLGALTYLRLDTNSLSSSLPSQLGLLTKLQTLYLYSNKFTSTVPTTIGNLQALTFLSLSTNSLSPSIPSQLGLLTNLQYLSLSNNKFTSAVPTTIGNLGALTYLDLGINSLSSSIPSQLGLLTNLQVLGLNNIQFTSAVPTIIGNLKALSHLDLSTNRFSSSIPSQLGLLTKLQRLYLSSNKFTSAVPSSFCSLSTGISLQIQSDPGLTCLPSCLTSGSYTKLTKDSTIATCGTASVDGAALCDIYSQQSAAVKTRLTNWCPGSAPYNPCSTTPGAWAGVTCATVGGASRVVGLDVGSKGLTGSLPTTIGNLGALTNLRLSINSLSSSLPSQLGLLTNLQGLSLWNNLFTSALPTAIGNLGALTSLTLSTNRLVSSLPSQLGLLTKLLFMDLSSNQFSSTLPTTIGNLGALTWLSLGSNFLISSIPSQVFLLTNLQYLWLGVNRLTSTLPTAIGNLGALTYLDLQSNSLSSSLPLELCLLTNLQRLYLSRNKFTSTVPTNIGNLKALTFLGLTSNSLSSSIPSQLGLLTKLLVLYLDSNKFTSAVPSSFCGFRTGISLYISSNPGLTCLPSCLTNPPYTQLTKDATLTAVCPAAPSPAPTPIPVPSALPTPSPTKGSLTFGYVGPAVPAPTWVVAATGMYTVEAWGAGAGTGKGGYVAISAVRLTANSVLTLIVGGEPTGSVGGFGGGGSGTRGQGGAGASIVYVRLGSAANPNEVLVVAGGAGGNGNGGIGGNGGGSAGQDGTVSQVGGGCKGGAGGGKTPDIDHVGGGGSLEGGGGIGEWGGGGGGGWKGGAGGDSNGSGCGGGGGGGSSYTTLGIPNLPAFTVVAFQSGINAGPGRIVISADVQLLTTGPSTAPSAMPSAYPSLSPSPLPSSVPTLVPTASMLCQLYTAGQTNTDTVNFPTCGVTAAAGQTFTVSTCGVLYAGATCTGQTTLRVYSSSGVEVIYDDTGTGSLPPAVCISGSNTCAQVQYTVPAGTPTQTYVVREGCLGQTTCTATAVISGVAGVQLVTYSPTPAPSALPSTRPSPLPSFLPSANPSLTPSALPSTAPSAFPSPVPSFVPSGVPTLRPTTALPTPQPSALPSANPTMTPGPPTALPTALPTAPSQRPSSVPTLTPTSSMQCQLYMAGQTNTDTVNYPTCGVTASAGQTFTVSTCGALYPLAMCSGQTTLRVYTPGGVEVIYDDTGTGSLPPAVCISGNNTCAQVQYTVPAGTPMQTYIVREGCLGQTACAALAVISGAAGVQLVTYSPTAVPTLQPTSATPSAKPSPVPTFSPTRNPTCSPTSLPSVVPSPSPSALPTVSPSQAPSSLPTVLPSAAPTLLPSLVPSPEPTNTPTTAPPSPAPSALPSANPTMATKVPTPWPTALPTAPSPLPSALPTRAPTASLFCGPFRAASTNSDVTKFALCGVTASAGQTFTVSMCGALFSGASCTGSTVLRVFTAGGVEVAYDDTGTGGLPPAACYSGGNVCAQVQYTVPAGALTQTYLIQEGCSGIAGCSGSAVVAGTVGVQLVTYEPTPSPSLVPSPSPSALPSLRPSAVPTVSPTPVPSTRPSPAPSALPSTVPSFAPSGVPTLRPTTAPPSPQPSARPSANPTVAPGPPTALPTARPTSPSPLPSSLPTLTPTATTKCQLYTAGQTNTDTVNYPTCGVTASAGQTFTVSTCGALYQGALCTGQTTLRVYTPGGVEVIYDDTGTGSMPPAVCIMGGNVCAQVQYTVPAGTATQTYVVREGCLGQTACKAIAVISGAAGVQLVTYTPTPVPSVIPSAQPSPQPSLVPSAQPSPVPTWTPSALPTPAPSALPSAAPSFAPSGVPTLRPTTALPTPQPSALPSANPTVTPGPPTALPTALPTSPSPLPSAAPTLTPTSSMQCQLYSAGQTNTDTVNYPTCGVTASAGQTFTVSTCGVLFAGASCTGQTTLRVYTPGGVEVIYDDTGTGSLPPAVCISGSNTCAQVQYTVPAGTPTQTYVVREGCLGQTTCTATAVISGVAGVQLVTYAPTPAPSAIPSASPSFSPSSWPSVAPSPRPSTFPSPQPTAKPSVIPTSVPSARPTAVPTSQPTVKPTPLPTRHPTSIYTLGPTRLPTPLPTALPTTTLVPSVLPTPLPSAAPTHEAAASLSFAGGSCSEGRGSCAVSHPFTGLLSLAVPIWYLQVEVWSTGLSQPDAVQIQVSNPVTGSSLASLYCTPGNGCANGGPQPVVCAANIAISSSMLDPKNGGSLGVASSVSANSFGLQSCQKNGQGSLSHELFASPESERALQAQTARCSSCYFYVRYNLTAFAVPTLPPSAAPSINPTPSPTGSINQALAALSVQSPASAALMTNGAPLYVVFVVAILFGLIGFSVAKAKNQMGFRLGNQVYTGSGFRPAMVSMALIGSNFVCECFFLHLLLWSLSGYAIYAYILIVGRVFIFGVAAFLFSQINDSHHELSIRMNHEMLGASKEFSAVSLICLVDVTAMPFLPWRDSGFIKKTGGYPTPEIFWNSAYTKIAHSLLLIICQAIYLDGVVKRVGGGAAMPNSVAFMCLNITITVAVLLTSVFEAAGKMFVLHEWEAKDKEAAAMFHSKGGGRAGDLELTGAYPEHDVPAQLRSMERERRDSFSSEGRRSSLSRPDAQQPCEGGTAISPLYFQPQPLPLPRPPVLLSPPPVQRTRSMLLTRDSIPGLPAGARLSFSQDQRRRDSIPGASTAEPTLMMPQPPLRLANLPPQRGRDEGDFQRSPYSSTGL